MDRRKHDGSTRRDVLAGVLEAGAAALGTGCASGRPGPILAAAVDGLVVGMSAASPDPRLFASSAPSSTARCSYCTAP